MTDMFRFVACVLLFSLLGVYPASSVSAQEPALFPTPVGTALRPTIPVDQSIAHIIADNFRQSGLLRNYNIYVAVYGGTVELTGQVSDSTQQQEAIRLTQGVPGVDRVLDRLTLTAGEPIRRVQAEAPAPSQELRMPRAMTDAPPASGPGLTAPVPSHPIFGGPGIGPGGHGPRCLREPEPIFTAPRPTASGSAGDPGQGAACAGDKTGAAGSETCPRCGDRCPPEGCPRCEGVGPGGANGPGSPGAVGGGYEQPIPRCPGCGAPCPFQARFCPWCGMNTTSASGGICQRCGTSCPAGTSFCPECAAPVPQPGMPGSYPPPMPPYAWPSYAPYPNFSRVATPLAYPPNAFPYIGPIYPFPKVPLGWRAVTLEWDDNHWFFSPGSTQQDWWRLRYW